jgi:hypothetical protein
MPNDPEDFSKLTIEEMAERYMTDEERECFRDPEKAKAIVEQAHQDRKRRKEQKRKENEG